MCEEMKCAQDLMTDTEFHKLSALLLGMPQDSMSMAQLSGGEARQCLPCMEACCTCYVLVVLGKL